MFSECSIMAQVFFSSFMGLFALGYACGSILRMLRHD